MKDETKSRLFINTIKGLAIFLMLWGHCIQCCSLNTFDFFENGVFKFIYSFHMPLFMLVSGYLFHFSSQKRDVKELIVHRAKPLIWTIVAGNIIIWLCTTVLFGFLSGNYSIIIGGGWIHSLNGLWFLWSVLSSSLGVALICKKIKSMWLQILLLCLWGGVVLLFPNADNNLYMYPYYVIGFYFAKYKDKINKKFYIISKYLSLLLFPLMLLFFEKRHYIYTSGVFGGNYIEGFWAILKTDMFRWVIGLLGSVFVLVVVEFLFNSLYRAKSGGFRKLLLPLDCIGKNSLQIYVLSSIFLSGYLPIVYHKCVEILGRGNFLANSMWMYNLIFTPILAIIYLVALHYIVKLLYKLKIGEYIFSK